MTQEEIKQAASEYNHKRFKANGMMDTKMSYEIFMAFCRWCELCERGNDRRFCVVYISVLAGL